MNDMGYGGFGGPLLAIIGIWSVVGLGVYVWYLWALARLFPYLGLPAAHGWIPVWNQWRLIERGGLPGWTAIVGIVPGLNIVTIVMSIMSIHRINREHEESGGMTVLGALLPPMWATMLGTRLQDRGYAAETGQPGFPRAQGQGLVEYGPDGQVFPLLPNAAPAPAPQQFGMPPVPQGAGASPAAAGPAGPAPTPAQRPAATPLSPGGFPAPAGRARPEPPILPPAVPGAPGAAGGSAVPSAPGSQATPGASTGNPWGLGNTTEGNFQRLASEQPPSRDASFGSSFDSRPFSWPQPAPIPPEAPLLPAPTTPPAAQRTGAESAAGAQDDAWTPSARAVEAAAAAAEPPADEQSAMPEVVAETRVTAAGAAPVLPPLAPPVHPSVQAPQSAGAEGSEAADPGTPTPRGATLPEPVRLPERAQLPEPAGLPEPARLPEPATLGEPTVLPEATPLPAPTRLPEPGRGPVVAAPVDSAAGPGVAGLLGTPVAPAPLPELLDEELDETVVVSRRARWAIELPDGQQLELASDDVVVGRKPVAVAGSDVLVIPDSTRTLSKSHARLRLSGDGWTIEDLDSTNGVFTVDAAGEHTELVPGKPVPATEHLVIGTLEVRLGALD